MKEDIKQLVEGKLTIEQLVIDRMKSRIKQTLDAEEAEHERQILEGTDETNQIIGDAYIEAKALPIEEES